MSEATSTFVILDTL